jgi:Tol biopolymer transport system component
VSVASGQSLAHYLLVGKIGVGGMGEVWRAADTTLRRDVAIKVLPDALALDAERAARFDREARVLASLNHPGIASIYGFHDAGTRKFIAMELVPGEDLAQRIARGPSPLDEALSIALRISEAVEYAHERGVVHRDLKPANVKVALEGAVKVLDFGLAKAISGEAEPGAPTSSPASVLPTITTGGTAAGIVLGTAAYMSPEQARGRPVDQRADIWAFGCVLYEMLAGRRPFEGETATDTIAAVLTRDPDWSRLPPEVPPEIRRLLRRCLERDPRKRLRDIGEARIVLEGGAPEAAADPASAAPPAKARRARLLAGALAAGSVLAASTLALLILRPAPAARAVRLALPAPPGWTFQSAPLVSPDGGKVVFAAGDEDGKEQLFRRDLDASEAAPLPGTEGARFPFWSPDGTAVEFCDGISIKSLDLDGGLVRVFAPCDESFRGGAWAPDGTLLVAPTSNGPILALPSAGGAARPVTPFDANVPDLSHRFPALLPDGRRFLYLAWSNAAQAPDESLGLFVADPRDGSARRVSSERSGAAVIGSGRDAHLLFVRGGSLVAVPFDLSGFRTRGGETILEAGIGILRSSGYASFSATSHGDIVTLPTAGTSSQTPGWVDRTGRDLGFLPDSALYQDLAISQDGSRVAAEVLDSRKGWSDLWVVDVERGISTRLTSGPHSRYGPIWNPDGGALGFTSEATGRNQPYVMPADGSGGERLLAETQHDDALAGWSPDGSWILLRRAAARFELWARSLRDGGETPICRVEGDCDAPSASPDGRWVVFAADHSGRSEICVRSFQGAGGLLQISTAGGADPHRRNDGREILYRDPDGWVVAVTVEAAGPLRYGKPERLARLEPRTMATPAPDHQRLLSVQVETGAAALALVLLGRL